MTKSYMGLILAAQNTGEIRGLTKYRPIASIPFAGRYRIVDFALTNLTRSGISNIGIIVNHKYVRSLRDHIRGGQFWDLNRKEGGIFLMHPTIGNEVTKETMGSFRANLEYLHNSKEENVIIFPGNLVANIDMNKIIEDHEESGKDLTVVYKNIKEDLYMCKGATTLTFDKEDKLENLGILVNPKEPTNVSLNIKIIKKSVLIDLIMSGVQDGLLGDLNKFVEHRIHKIPTNFYEFNGYANCVISTKNYSKISKDFLRKEIRDELLLKNGGISTKINDTPPAVFEVGAKVSNSLIANGCVIDGTIKNSIIGRRVNIKKGAIVENSIILQSCTIEEETEIRNVIIDKNVVVRKYEKVIGSEDFPLVIEKRSLLDE
jgi:glucose-1-phosphate adenylyltransferase